MNVRSICSGQSRQRWENATIEALLANPVIHVDETSMSVNGQNKWVVVISVVLLFARRPEVPFTKHCGEESLRMGRQRQLRGTPMIPFSPS